MLSRAALFVSLTFVACAAPPGPADAAVEVPDAATLVVDAGFDAGTPDAGPVVCAAASLTSRCGESALVRGVARFDPARVPDGGVPVLRLTLRHGFVLIDGEEQIGGRLHMWKNVPVPDVARGEVPFELDMCALGTAMWSEENGAFHLVGILDFNGNNDLDQAQSNEDAIAMGHADFWEPAGLLDVTVSCHQPSPCVALPLDCIDGTVCTTITPMTACTKQQPSCPSGDAFCQ